MEHNIEMSGVKAPARHKWLSFSILFTFICAKVQICLLQKEETNITSISFKNLQSFTMLIIVQLQETKFQTNEINEFQLQKR